MHLTFCRGLRAAPCPALGLWLFLSCTAASAQALPADVAAALARAGVPQSALSVVVQALPAATPVPAAAPELAKQADAANTPNLPTPAPTPAPLSAPRLSLRAAASQNPASVMKLITTYAALSTLGAGFTWKNRIYIDGMIIHGGVLEGNLVLRGGGDPKLVLERIQDMFAKVQAKGVREIRGDIILDRSVFAVPDKNPADFDDEPLRPYNAAPDGLLVNFKSLIYTFTPDPANQRVLIKTEPPIAGVDIPTELALTNGACGDWKTSLKADFFTPGKVSFAGRYSASCGEKVWPVAYSEPRAYAPRVIDAMWRASGGSLTGTVREDAVPRSARPLLTFDSLPLADIIADVNKYSNNVMAQQVFLSLSAHSKLGRAGRPGSFEASTRAMAAWWSQTLPSAAAPTLENGSGLSRKERSNVLSLTALLHHAAASPQAAVFANSLSVAGVDGTSQRMKERNAESVALGNAQLKTGTLRDVAAVAGYATGHSGQRYSIAAIINHPNAGSASARQALDKLVEWTVKDRP